MTPQPPFCISLNILKTLIHKDTCASVCCSITYSGQDVEITEVSFSRWLRAEGVVHVCNGVLLSRKKT